MIIRREDRRFSLAASFFATPSSLATLLRRGFPHAHAPPCLRFLLSTLPPWPVLLLARSWGEFDPIHCCIAARSPKTVQDRNLCSADTRLVVRLQLSVQPDCRPIGCSCHQGCVLHYVLIPLTTAVVWLTNHPAAVERVPEVKPEDVEEVFFGNVLSAGYVDTPNPSNILRQAQGRS